MPNVIKCIDQRFAFTNSGISCLALIFNLSNQGTTILSCTQKDAKTDDWLTVFFVQLMPIYGSVFKMSCIELGDMGSILDGCCHRAETPCLPLAISRGTEPVSALRHALLYCCTLYNTIQYLYIYIYLGFRHFQSSTDRVLTLNMNIQVPLFWSTWSRAQGPHSATCVGLAHGRDYSYCSLRASEQKSQKSLAFFSFNCRKYLKTMAHCEGFSNLIPQPVGLNLSLKHSGERILSLYVYTTWKPLCSAECWIFFSQWSKFHFPIFFLLKLKVPIYSVSLYWFSSLCISVQSDVHLCAKRPWPHPCITISYWPVWPILSRPDVRTGLECSKIAFRLREQRAAPVQYRVPACGEALACTRGAGTHCGTRTTRCWIMNDAVLVCTCKVSARAYTSCALRQHAMPVLLTMNYPTSTSTAYCHKPLLPLPFDWNKCTPASQS